MHCSRCWTSARLGCRHCTIAALAVGRLSLLQKVWARRSCCPPAYAWSLAIWRRVVTRVLGGEELPFLPPQMCHTPCGRAGKVCSVKPVACSRHCVAKCPDPKHSIQSCAPTFKLRPSSQPRWWGLGGSMVDEAARMPVSDPPCSRARAGSASRGFLRHAGPNTGPGQQ